MFKLLDLAQQFPKPKAAPIRKTIAASLSTKQENLIRLKLVQFSRVVLQALDAGEMEAEMATNADVVRRIIQLLTNFEREAEAKHVQHERKGGKRRRLDSESATSISAYREEHLEDLPAYWETIRNETRQTCAAVLSQLQLEYFVGMAQSMLADSGKDSKRLESCLKLIDEVLVFRASRRVGEEKRENLVPLAEGLMEVARAKEKGNAARVLAVSVLVRIGKILFPPAVQEDSGENVEAAAEKLCSFLLELWNNSVQSGNNALLAEIMSGAVKLISFAQNYTYVLSTQVVKWALEDCLDKKHSLLGDYAVENLAIIKSACQLVCVVLDRAPDLLCESSLKVLVMLAWKFQSVLREKKQTISAKAATRELVFAMEEAVRGVSNEDEDGGKKYRIPFRSVMDVAKDIGVVEAEKFTDVGYLLRLLTQAAKV